MGNEVFKTVVKATGLPETIAIEEVAKILNGQGIDRDEVSLENLREAAAKYLRESLLDIKEKFEDGVWLEDET